MSTNYYNDPMFYTIKEKGQFLELNKVVYFILKIIL